MIKWAKRAGRELRRILTTGWLPKDLCKSSTIDWEYIDVIFGESIKLADLVAGALSMAAGEYVSVSSQSDIETADLKRENK